MNPEKRKFLFLLERKSTGVIKAKKGKKGKRRGKSFHRQHNGGKRYIMGGFILNVIFKKAEYRRNLSSE